MSASVLNMSCSGQVSLEELKEIVKDVIEWILEIQKEGRFLRRDSWFPSLKKII